MGSRSYKGPESRRLISPEDLRMEACRPPAARARQHLRSPRLASLVWPSLLLLLGAHETLESRGC